MISLEESRHKTYLEMAQRRTEEKRKTLVYNLAYYCKEAAKLTVASTQHEIKNRIETLKETYQKFKQTLELENNEAYDVDPDREQNMKTENEYITHISRLQSFVIEVDPIDQLDQPLHQSTFIAHDYIQQQFDIPKFSGNFEEWKSFKDLFVSATVNTRLSDAQKLQKLKSLLVGDAFNAIRHLSITVENFRVAMKLLNDRYDNKRAIVNKHLRLFFDMPKIVDADSKAILKIINTTNECIYSLNALGVNTDSWSPMLVHYIELRFNRCTFQDWEYYLRGTTEIPTITQMLQFLETQARMFESVEWNASHEKSICDSIAVPSTSNQKSLPYAYKCPACNEAHRLFECSSFKAKPSEERIKLVKDKKLCENCLSGGHSAANCKSRFTCVHCKEKHNTLLHPNKRVVAHIQTQENANGDSEDEEHLGEQECAPVEEVLTLHTKTNAKPSNSHVLLSTAMVNVRAKNGSKSVKVRCLLDNCAQGSFISEEIVQLLKLKKTKVNASATAISGAKLQKIKHTVDFEFSSLDKKFAYTTSAMVVKSVSAIRSTPKIAKQKWPHLEDIELADPNYQKAGCIDLLLSAEIYAMIVLTGVRKGEIGTPVAVATELGWTIIGPTNKPKSQEIITAHITVDEIDANLKRFWDLEEMITNEKTMDVDNEAENHFVKTHKRDENGAFIVRLPFKNEVRPKFVGTRKRALRRLIQSEVSMKKKPELKMEYGKSIQEFIDLNHVEVSMVQGRTDNGFFMSHHAVIKATSSTTKVRPVFDASAKDDFGSSLNDHLIAGPPIQPKLAYVLTNWRMHKYVIAADLEKMYRMIKVDERDCKYQQFVWRANENDAILNLTHKRLTFGTANAAFQAVRCIKQLAYDEKDDFPNIATSIIKSSYIDDIYLGTETIDELIILKNELIEFFTRGGFSLRKWASNTNDLLNEIPQSDKEINSISIAEHDAMRTLGVIWYPYGDDFAFHVNFDIDESKCTKRMFLSQI